VVSQRVLSSRFALNPETEFRKDPSRANYELPIKTAAIRPQLFQLADSRLSQHVAVAFADKHSCVHVEALPRTERRGEGDISLIAEPRAETTHVLAFVDAKREFDRQNARRSIRYAFCAPRRRRRRRDRARLAVVRVVSKRHSRRVIV